jgi:diketogulonate reductase-like aldo/keto reductase
MRHKELHDGRKVPVFGLGTGGFGSHPDKDLRALKAALDMGYTHIDTAEVYGDGESEKLIGRALQGVDREAVWLTSKVAKHHLRKKQVMQAIEGSLSRLGTDHLDLYLIHAPDPEVPLEETFEAMNELVSQGKTRYIGVSNFDRDQTDQAFKLTDSLLATNQVHYNLLVREPENNGVLEYCQEHDVLLTAYSPLENGDVTDSEMIINMAEDKGCTPAQLALAWLINKPTVITIAQSNDEEHLKENLGCLDVELSAGELRALDNLAS